MIGVDWFEELGHNAIYIHVYENDQNCTLWACHDLQEIEDLIQSGFFTWENNDELINYLRSLDIIKPEVLT